MIKLISIIVIWMIVGAISIHAADDEKSQTIGLDSESSERAQWVFTPFGDERDPLYNVEELALVEVELREYIKSKDEKANDQDAETLEAEPSLADLPDDAHELDIALAKSREHGSKAEQSLLELEYENTIREAQKGLDELEKVVKYAKHPKYHKVKAQKELLHGFLKNSQEAQLNQLAEERFNGLNLQVQGIMWSADKKSLAIISGRHVYVQDKIGEGDDKVTIVNIDPNRVDFMINYKRRRFEFKRIIGE
ncbi:MAG: hypothetical protein HRU15_14285 [Planctomycetes bacterium]|nr:hypothetical protein [Planctomycetota bacterium]